MLILNNNNTSKLLTIILFFTKVIGNVNGLGSTATTTTTTTTTNTTSRTRTHTHTSLLPCKPNNRLYKYQNTKCSAIRTDEALRQSYCQLDEVREECPQSCGLCCQNDPDYTFRIPPPDKDSNTNTNSDADTDAGGIRSSTAKNRQKTCEWLGRGDKTELLHYCDDYQSKIKNACTESCNFCKAPVSLIDTATTDIDIDDTNTKKSSTNADDDDNDNTFNNKSSSSNNNNGDNDNETPNILSSTTTPTTTCVEDHSFRTKVNEINYSCVMIRNRQDIQQKLCSQQQQQQQLSSSSSSESDNIKIACPITCGLCCNDDKTYTFQTKSLGGRVVIEQERSCDWLAAIQNDNMKMKLCNRHKNGRFIREACAKTCNSCMSVNDLSIVKGGGGGDGSSEEKEEEDKDKARCGPGATSATTTTAAAAGIETNNKDSSEGYDRDGCGPASVGKQDEVNEEDDPYPIGLTVTLSLVIVLILLAAFAHFCTNDDDGNEDENLNTIATRDSTKIGGGVRLSSSSGSTTSGSSTTPHHDENKFPKLGVKLSYLDEFITKCGGRTKLIGLTTAQVNDLYVKVMTKKYSNTSPPTSSSSTSYTTSSLCEMLQRDPNHKSVVGNATVFISHVWQYEFLNVIDTLQYHMQDMSSSPNNDSNNNNNNNTIIWFDLFSMNQHNNDDIHIIKQPYEYYNTTFMAAIKEMGHTIMVISPWNDQLQHTRAWCIYEAYCTRVGKCKFEIALNENDKEQLIKDMENHPNIEAMIGEIDIEKSLAYHDHDKEMITRVIKDSVGFHSGNEIVFDLMRRWVIGMAKEELEKNSEDEGRIWKLLHMLGMQFQGQGKLELSKQLLEKCLQQQKDTLGQSHPQTLMTLQNLSDLYCKLEMYDKAKAALSDVFLRRKATLGKSHQDTIGTLHNLAAIYLVERDYNEAKRIYEDVIQIRRSTLGASHPLTLNTLSNLALLYRDNGELEQSKIMYEEVLQARKTVLGETHPKTLSTLHNLASLYGCIGKQYEARMMFQNCLTQQKEVLGESHPDTLGTLNNLAVLYHKEGEYMKAAKMYEECLGHQKATLGEEHPDTLGTLQNLALLYEKSPP